MSSDDELKMYIAQIAAIDRQLEGILSGQERDELQEAKNDLLELVELLKEENEQDSVASSSTQDSSTQQIAEEFQIDFDEFVGMRVSATAPRFHLPITHHSAIILEVFPAQNAEIMAKVLFSTPLLAGMKPCPHFLSGTCKFNEKCRFSHGELVSMKDFDEYKEPDYSTLQDGSLVLVAIEGGLWDVGRVVSHDHKEYAIKLLKSGKEVASTIEKVIPLDADIELQEDEPKVSIPNDSWSELKQETCGKMKVGDLGNWNGGGFGLKMMQKMGYKIGEGLGKNSDGIVHAVQAVIFPKNKGLNTKGEGKSAETAQEAKKRVTKTTEQPSIGFDCDIFEFINRKLQTEKAKNVVQIIKEEKKEMDKCSERDLGIRGLDIESEIKELRSKQRKLKEGIRRNQNDSRTVAKMESSIQSIQKEINRLEGRHSRLHKELKDRKDKKREIF